MSLNSPHVDGEIPNVTKINITLPLVHVNTNIPGRIRAIASVKYGRKREKP